MRILHTYHKGLPEHRIECEAFIAKQAGHTLHFLGMGSRAEPELDVFESICTLRSINNRQVVKDKKIRQEWKEAVQEVNPDVIHANDIIAAKFSSETGYPMVYDDREYWTKQRILYESWPLWKRIAIRPFTEIIPEWERQLLSNYLTITVSEGIAAEHRKVCENVVVLRNLGLRSEFEGLDTNKHRSGIVYVGSDFERGKFSRHRDMTGLVDWLDFDVLSGLPRSILYKKLTRYRIGLLPFRTTEYSKYSGSAKTFDYLNCGLQVLMTRDLYEAHGNLPYTHPFDNYEELESLVSSIDAVDPEEIMQYANENLVWEAQSESLLDAYRQVLSK